MSESELLLRFEGPIAWVTLNRETRRNALSLGMIDLFHEYLDRIEHDKNVRALCITASGDKAFCSGADLASSFDRASYEDGAKRYAALLTRLASFGLPIVARINGNCLAGGMGLMLSCDLAYAKVEAKFGTPELNVGLFPMMIGALIFRNSFPKKALEMVYRAVTVSAQEAERMGLITKAVPADELDRVVADALQDIGEKAPLAASLGRKAFAAAREMPLDRALEFLCTRLGDLIETEDAKEGLTAFFEKRKPEWKGR
jgi:enoyl-CoA hydratase/carnithine racemase